jgi:tetratricopeptide (TPR) repeat protein
MKNEPTFDKEAAHKFFSASCFNSAWELIEKSARTAEEDEQMIRLAQASVWHWTQRADVTNKNLSIGYWQLSRVYALAGQPDNALRYGHLCLEVSREETPFCLGYAYEALARAAYLAKDTEQAQAYLAESRKLSQTIPNAEEKQLLENDLETIVLVS